MNWWIAAAAFASGALSMLALVLWLLYQSHENFRKMCIANARDDHET